jgi:hypothetical protein
MAALCKSNGKECEALAEQHGRCTAWYVWIGLKLCALSDMLTYTCCRSQST